MKDDKHNGICYTSPFGVKHQKMETSKICVIDLYSQPFTSEWVL